MAFSAISHGNAPTQSKSIPVDSTQQQNDALGLEAALRALRTLSAGNEELFRARCESEFLRAVCRVAVEKGDYLMAWVGFAEHGQDMAVRPVAHYGTGEEYLSTADITWADTDHGRGPTGSAIRTSQIQVNQNVLTNSVMAPWREAALKHGYQSSIALPLKGESAILGALSLYARERDAFGEGEVAVLRELASALAFGIVTLRARTEYDRNVERIRQYEARIRQGLEEVIQAVSTAMEMRDGYTCGHQKRVTALSVAIAAKMGLSEDEVRAIKIAASVHDIGTLKVPAAILAKTGSLSDSERSLIQEHASAGHDILKDITCPWPLADIVWQHHERLDGSGYPRGLRGDDILLAARIIAVAQELDEMASAHVYRPAMGIDVALAEIERGRGTIFDAAVVDICVQLFRQEGFTL
ncbi:MAG: GAF domain-containing protein [Burkholderiales bacterium]|nr:GAF domain-containing protein [Burkholderiales bacterium]